MFLFALPYLTQAKEDMTDAELEELLPKRPSDGAITSIGALLHAEDKCSQCVLALVANPVTKEKCKNKSYSIIPNYSRVP